MTYLKRKQRRRARGCCLFPESGPSFYNRSCVLNPCSVQSPIYTSGFTSWIHTDTRLCPCASNCRIRVLGKLLGFHWYNQEQKVVLGHFCLHMASLKHSVTTFCSRYKEHIPYHFLNFDLGHVGDYNVMDPAVKNINVTMATVSALFRSNPSSDFT